MILGIGLSCIDVVMQVDDPFFSECGLEGKGFSMNVEIDKFQRILEAARGNPLILPGGIAANTIRGLAKLGEKCAFLSCRGKDSFGDLLAQDWKGLNVLDLAIVLPDYPTARALCLITPDGQRTIFAASKKYRDLFSRMDNFRNANFLHLEAYSLAEVDDVEQLLKVASKENKTISMSLSSIEAVPKQKHKILNLLERYVDIVFANEDEMETLFHLPPEEACRKLGQTCPIVVVTQGARGCLVANEGKLMGFPAIPAEVVDTTGAGDLFASGFLYGLQNGFPVSKCAKIGNFIGSVAVKTMGVALPEEKWEEIRAYLKKYIP